MTTTTASETVTALTAALRDGIRHLRGREPRLINEATTLSVIIRPTLEALGYPATHRIPEYGGQRNRLDESCFLHPVGSAPGYATLIVEAKQIGADFDRAAPSQGRSTSPDRQIQRYLKQHAASGPSTLGVLTDGVKWRIYRRAGSPANPDVELLVEHNFTALVEGGQQALDIESGPALEPAIQEQIEDLVARLSWQSFSYATVPAQRPTAVNPADEFLRVFAAPDVQPAHILTAAMAEPALSLSYNIADDVNLQGIGRDVHDEDWEAYTYTRAALVQSDSPGIAGSRAVVAAVRFAYKPGGGLARPDTALCARIFARADPSRTAAVIAYSASPNGDLEARLAVAVGNQVNMTAVFDPTLPAPSARAAITRLLPLLRDTATDGLPAGRLLEPVEVATLRQQFYREIAQWTGRMQHDASPPRRQAILRHLIRVMFSWILKETDNDTYRIPAALFEPAFIRANLPDHYDYHRDVLRFLFHQRLNVDAERRQPHSVPAIEQELDAAPFLNGSLFAEHPNDNDLTLALEDYWSADPERPGLFTVLSRYHWTMDEHRPGESEQTLDPELLSNLFERLITPTQEGSAPPLRQPQGTYYTPADVADEMVKDALAAAVRDYTPSEVADSQLLDLFGAADEPLLQLTERQRDRLLQRIKKLRIFDPAVGSGEFLFSMLTALQRAIRKLDSDHQVAAADIIEGQLFGQDINPLAVQIARLRLFIAIIADRAPGVSPPPPSYPYTEPAFAEPGSPHRLRRYAPDRSRPQLATRASRPAGGGGPGAGCRPHRGSRKPRALVRRPHRGCQAAGSDAGHATARPPELAPARECGPGQPRVAGVRRGRAAEQ